MGIFADISAFTADQRKKRNDDIDRFFPILKKWKNIEKELSPDEKEVEKVFFMNTFIFGLILFLVASISPHLSGEDSDFWPKGGDNIYYTSDYLTAEVGFFGKSSIPTIGDIERSDMSDVITYEVQPGESTFLIAKKFGISVKTLLENNDIPNQNNLKTGKILKILPVDGVLYTVKSGDTLSGVSKKFNIDQEKIRKQNGMKEDSFLVRGKSIIIPGGKKIKIPEYIPPKVVVKAPVSKSSSGKKTVSKSSTVYVKPPKYTPPKVASGKNVWPVRGRGQITQYYHRGHYAVDIWGPNRPDILAMRDGIVTRAAGGCASRQRGCNGGYGNVIEITHSGGLKTLYAHNTSFYVRRGQKVKAGQAIAKMGNTGTVYGRTGIHTHFEVRKNGKRVNPLIYIK